MNQQQAIMAVIVIGLIGVSLPCLAGGKSVYTERSVEELKLMTTPEVVGEARLICHDIVIGVEFGQKYREGGQKSGDLRFYDNAERAYQQTERGRRYLERVGFVLRDRHRGQMPVWFEKLLHARNELDCDTAATAGGWRPKP